MYTVHGNFDQHYEKDFSAVVLLTLSQTSPGFYLSAVLVFKEHSGKRRNCSWRAISPFPTMFSTRLENLLPFSSNSKSSPANSFSLDWLKKLLFGNELTHYQTKNFRLFQTQRVFIQFLIWQKWQKALQTGRKHCRKRRNCSLRAISPFPTVFSKGFFPGASKGVIVWECIKC